MNEKYIRELEARDKRYKKYLGGNLLIEVHPSGKKVYRVKHPHKTITIGSSKEYSYKQARKIAEDLNIKLRVVKPESVPFAFVVDEWLKQKDWADSTRRSRELSIRKHLHLWSKRTIQSISRREIIDLVCAIDNEGYHSNARRILGILEEIFGYALDYEYIDKNPATNITKRLKKYEETPRKAFTKEEDIRRLLIAIEDMNEVNKALFKFTMFTLVRPSEARLAKWSEISGNVWTIPKERTKMRREHTIGLPSQCLEILADMEKIQKNEYIFPSPTKNSHLSEGTLAKALKVAGISPDEMTLHGLRSMASTVLNEKIVELGLSNITGDVIEKALAHVGNDKVRATYNRALYSTSREFLLQFYADYLDELKLGEKLEKELPIIEFVESTEEINQEDLTCNN